MHTDVPEVIAMTKRTKITHIGDYCAGHPWYYVRGNEVLSPKEIRQSVMDSGYRGYLKDDIMQIDQMPEPKRSQKLRALRDKIMQELRQDISRYRQCNLELHRLRVRQLVSDEPFGCYDVHTNIGLKHNHIYNRFAHLILLDELDTQLDMFG